MFDLLRFDKTSEFVVVDFETESLCLYTPRNLPWQVGMIKFNGVSNIEEYARFIKWHRPPNVSEGAARVTHFDPTNVEKYGVDYKEVVKTIVDWTKSAKYILGQNFLGFDIYILQYMYRMMGESTDGIAEKVLDTHALAKGLKINYKYNPETMTLLGYQYTMINTIVKKVKTNLEALGREYGIEHDFSSLHDALSDVSLNIKVWHKLKFQVDI